MQMALPSALRKALLCFLAQALLAPGFSVSNQRSLRIPEGSRVTTVANLASGQGVVRPPPVLSTSDEESSSTSSGSSGGGSTGSPGASGSQTPAVDPSVGARMWKIDALFEMTTTATLFTDEYASSTEGVSLTFADRLMWATDVPMSRFAFWFPTKVATVDASNMVFCESSNNEHSVGGWAARFSTAKNTTYKCEPQKHTANATTATVLLQRTAATHRGTSLSFEVGVYPASGVNGDTKPAVQVAQEVVEIANSGDEPKRILHKTGLWTYKAGPGVKFHGLFPGCSAVMPGAAFSSRDTSLPLGPNPGGHGASPLPPSPPGATPEQIAQEQKENQLATVDTVVHEAKQISEEVSNSLQELQGSLARASAVHSAWMNWNPYKLPAHLVGP